MTSETEVGNYSYSHLFAATVLFSALANASFTTYLFLRGIPTVYELFLVSAVFCTLFAALGQRVGRIAGGGAVILGVSSFSVTLTYRLFFDSRGINTVGGDMVTYSLMCGLFGVGAWAILTSLWSSLRKRSIEKKRWVVISATLAVTICSLIIFMFYNSIIVSFFDSHPWIATLIAIVVSSVVAYIIGGRHSRGKG